MIIGLSHLHSSLRYVVLIFLFLAILDAILAVSSDKPYAKTSKLFALITLISAHIQLLLGLALYFIGDKGFKIITSVEGFMSIARDRFFAMEHISGMILAIVLYCRIQSGQEKRNAEAEIFDHTSFLRNQPSDNIRYDSMAIYEGLWLMDLISA